MGENHVDPHHPKQVAVGSKEGRVVGDRENLGLVFPGVNRTPEGFACFGRVGVPGFLVGFGHAWNALQQLTPLSLLHRIDSHRAPAAATGVFVEQQLSVIAALHADETAVGSAVVDVIHGEGTHLVPEALGHRRILRNTSWVLLQPGEVEGVDPAGVAELAGETRREFHHRGVLAVGLADLQAAASADGETQHAEAASDEYELKRAQQGQPIGQFSGGAQQATWSHLDVLGNGEGGEPRGLVHQFGARESQFLGDGFAVGFHRGDR